MPPVADEYLVRSSPHSMNGYVRYSNDILFRLWANLEDAVREGTHRWPQTFDLEGPIFSSFFKTDDAMRTFLKGMHGFGLVGSPRVVEAFDLSPYRTFCDLGGATGHLVAAACDRYPKLQGHSVRVATCDSLRHGILAPPGQVTRRRLLY